MALRSDNAPSIEESEQSELGEYIDITIHLYSKKGEMPGSRYQCDLTLLGLTRRASWARGKRTYV